MPLAIRFGLQFAARPPATPRPFPTACMMPHVRPRAPGYHRAARGMPDRAFGTPPVSRSIPRPAHNMTTQPNRVSSSPFISDASVRGLADAVCHGACRAVDVADDALARLAAIAPLNAMVHVDAELARRTAERIDVRIAQGDALPLAGVPFVIKDNLDTADMPTLGASPAVNDYRATHDALTVRRLLDAGAVPLGKANMHELAFGITSGNRQFGAVGNPHDPRRIAGGSSGGTAAVVAAGIPFGLGTDTGGSVRIPPHFAACTACGRPRSAIRRTACCRCRTRAIRSGRSPGTSTICSCSMRC
jgi:mandelamide amidase